MSKRKTRKKRFEIALPSLIRALIKEGKIVTTEARAKAVARQAERLVTIGKKQDLSARRKLQKFLSESEVQKVMKNLAPLYKERPGGYTRLIKLPKRKSDSSPMAIVEFIK